ncbi:MAG: hypothetical protein INR62_08000, partial [Rhodospirillales bacterium]|nr:hypothetical protein [Acetobacter sp.]
MAHEIVLWRIEADGTVSSDTGHYRLVVQMVDGAVTYSVLRYPNDADRFPDAILATGTATDVRAAMGEAEGMAAQLTQVLHSPLGLNPIELCEHHHAGPDRLLTDRHGQGVDG